MRRLYVTSYGDPDVLEWREEDEPTPGPGEALVEVRAFSVIWADILERRGRYPGQNEAPFPSGHEFTGVVTAVGPGVDRVTVGTRVAGTNPAGGAASEVIVVPASILYPVPDRLDDVHAAALIANYVTAEIAIGVFAELKPTDSVLVHAAAGGLGSACIQLARVHGCGTIIGTAGGPEKAARVREIGADVGVDYLSEDFAEVTLEATGGAGASVCFESVGGDVLGRTFDCMAPAGRIVCMGASSGRSSERFRLQTLFEKGISVCGFTVGLWIDAGVPAVEEAAQNVLRYAADGAVSPVIAGVYGPGEVAEAHRRFESREAVGRVVVQLQDGR